MINTSVYICIFLPSISWAGLYSPLMNDFLEKNFDINEVLIAIICIQSLCESIEPKSTFDRIFQFNSRVWILNSRFCEDSNVHLSSEQSRYKDRTLRIFENYLRIGINSPKDQWVATTLMNGNNHGWINSDISSKMAKLFHKIIGCFKCKDSYK